MFNNLEIKKIGIFRALQLGDLMCAIPAIRVLKNKYPEAEIILIGLDWAKSFTERFSHYFSGFISFPGYPGLPEQKFNALAFDQFLKEIKSYEFDVIFQMQGNGSIVNSLIKKFGAKTIVGFDPIEDSITEQGSFLKYPGTIHEIDRHLALMAFAGMYSSNTALEFPVSNADRDELREIGLPIEKHKYVCIHPGSRGEWRQWPPLYFAQIADYCSALGYQIVLTGTAQEMQLIAYVTSLMKATPVIAAGQTSLGAMAALIEESFAIICNCTGVAHIASALEVSAVVISMDGEPWRWAPKNKILQPCVDWTKKEDYQAVLREVAALFIRI